MAHTHKFFEHKNTKTQRNVAISLFHNMLCFGKKKEALAFCRKKTCNPEPKLLLNRKFQDLRADKDKKRLAVISRFCIIGVTLGRSLRIASTKILLHPSKRMAWKILRHGVAEFFSFGCRSQTPYYTKINEYKKFLQIS